MLSFFPPVCVLLVSKLRITVAQGYGAHACRSVENMMTRIGGHVRTGNSRPIFLLALRDKKGQSVQINSHYLALITSHFSLVMRLLGLDEKLRLEKEIKPMN